MNYVYDCGGEEKTLTDDDNTKVEHGKYFVIVCNNCCDIPVLHMLRRKGDNDD